MHYFSKYDSKLTLRIAFDIKLMRPGCALIQADRIENVLKIMKDEDE